MNKIDSLLTRQRVIVYSRAILLTLILVFGIGSYVGHVNLAEFGTSDFRAFYTAGVLVKNSHDNSSIGLYDLDKQTSIQKEYEMIEDNQRPSIFINPPAYAWLMVPFSYMPYASASHLWLIINMLFAIISVIILTRQFNLDLNWWDIFILLVASYSGFSVFFLGQNTFIFLGLYAVSSMLLTNRHDFSAGVLLGLGALKPQLFLFLPVVLLFQKRWNVLAGFAVSALAVGSASVFLIGPDGIAEYYDVFSADLYLHGIHLQVHKMHSFPAFIRLIFGTEINAVHLSIISFLALSFWFGYLSLKKALSFNEPAILSLSLLGSLLVAPHLFHYDLAMLALPILVLYSWIRSYNISYPQARNYRLAFLALYLYLWLSHFVINTISLQVSVLLMIYLLAATIGQGCSDKNGLMLG